MRILSIENRTERRQAGVGRERVGLLLSMPAFVTAVTRSTAVRVSLHR